MFKFNGGAFKFFKEITKRFSRIEREVGKDVGLNSSEAKVISCLATNEQLTHTQLVELCDADKAAMSRVLFKMQEKKLIESNYNNNNRKTLYSKLTERGKMMAEKIKLLFEKHLEKSFGKLSESESKIMSAIYNKLTSKNKIESA